MIVMKFGGSSIESTEAMRRVCGIVHSHLHRRPVVVVSALGETTDQLNRMASEASTGGGYVARKLLNELQDIHFGFAAELLSSQRLANAEDSLRGLFRELFGLIHDLSEEGRLLTAEVSDYIASFGERLSSQLLAAALLEAGVPAAHLDASALIVTDDHFGAATPLQWETYARLRRAILQTGGDSVVVLGGFIAATQDGLPTTLGRGGSDLTASLVGAALSVEEIQIWTDVDGMLTCDPRVFAGGYRLRQISYAEASAMASSGAKVLHPDTVKPAIRQQIPVVVRNSRRPHVDGTRIVPAVGPSENIVKGIAVIQNLLLLAIRPPNLPDSASTPAALHDFLQRRSVGASFVKRTTDLIYAGFQNVPLIRKIEMELKGCVEGCVVGCVEGRLLTNYSLITLIGTGAGRVRSIVNRAAAALKGMDPIEFHGESADNSVSLAVPQRQSRRACELLHREFFSRVDASLFAPAFLEPVPSKMDRAATVDPLVTYAIRKTRILTRLNLGGHGGRTVVKGG